MELRPNGQRAKTAIVFLWITLALGIVSLVSQYFQYRMISDFLSGEAVTPEMAAAGDNRQRLIGFGYIIIYAITAVMFLRWFRRAFYNMELKAWPLRHTEFDTVLWWFIPIANWFKPYQVMRELYTRTELLLSENIEDYRSSKTFYTLGCWWALWILHAFAGYGSLAFIGKTKLPDLADQLIITMIGSVIGIPLALLAILIVQDYAEKEPLLFNIRNWKQDDFGSNLPELLQSPPSENTEMRTEP